MTHSRAKKGANHNVFRSHGNSNYPVKLVIHLSFYTAASTIQLHTYNTTTLQENLTHNPNAKQINYTKLDMMIFYNYSSLSGISEIPSASNDAIY